MCAAHVASMAGFSTYATLLPRLQHAWSLNNSQAGFISGAFFAGYMAAVPLLTSLTDRVDARRVYLVSSVVAAAALAGMAVFANGLFSASVLQLAGGAGIAGTYMPGLRALTDNVSGTSAQSRAISFYTAVFGLDRRLDGPSLGVRPGGDRTARRGIHGRARTAAEDTDAAARHAHARLPADAEKSPGAAVHLRLRRALLGAVRLALLARRLYRVRAAAASLRWRGARGLVGGDDRCDRQSHRSGGEHRRQRARDAPRTRAADLEGDARLGRAHLHARFRRSASVVRARWTRHSAL